MKRCIVCCAIAALCPPAGAAEPPTTSPEAQAVFHSDGTPALPDFFPIAVWLQSPANAERYRDIGVNTYVALWRGPTDEQLEVLRRSGMHVICDQRRSALESPQRDVIAGWMHGDEPDNAQERGKGKGYGPPIAPQQIVDAYHRMKAVDPTRPVMLNLGQGVAWDNWYGRGVRSRHPEDYPEYMKGCDIVSFDIYPVTHEKPEIAGHLEYVGRGVERLVQWTGGKKPVWCCIETTHISNPGALPTPAQVRQEVWMGIIHGATGIIYFCHEFKPKFIEAGLLAHPEIASEVKAIDAELTKLAPVLNSPTINGVVEVRSSDVSVPVTVQCKRHDGATYLFAISERDQKTRASFKLAGLPGKQSIQLIGEERTIQADNGRFEDDFDGYAVHLYRIAK